MPSRRNFIATSAAAITAAAFPKLLFGQRRGGDLFTPASLGPYIQGTMTQATFEAVLGSVFTAFLDNNAVAYLTLQKVTSANSAPLDGPLGGIAKPLMGMARPQSIAQPAPPNPLKSVHLVGFELIFNNGGAVFDQGSYLLDHGTLGRFACFLVPGMSSAGPTSCATFCSLINGTTPTRPLPVPFQAGW